jgi:hypothetical protein
MPFDMASARDLGAARLAVARRPGLQRLPARLLFGGLPPSVCRPGVSDLAAGCGSHRRPARWVPSLVLSRRPWLPCPPIVACERCRKAQRQGSLQGCTFPKRRRARHPVPPSRRCRAPPVGVARCTLRASSSGRWSCRLPKQAAGPSPSWASLPGCPGRGSGLPSCGASRRFKAVLARPRSTTSPLVSRRPVRRLGASDSLQGVIPRLPVPGSSPETPSMAFCPPSRSALSRSPIAAEALVVPLMGICLAFAALAAGMAHLSMGSAHGLRPSSLLAHSTSWPSASATQLLCTLLSSGAHHRGVFGRPSGRKPSKACWPNGAPAKQATRPVPGCPSGYSPLAAGFRLFT